MKTISAAMDVTVETEIQVVEIATNMFGKRLRVMLEIEGQRSWYYAGDKAVVTLNSHMDRNG